MSNCGLYQHFGVVSTPSACTMMGSVHTSTGILQWPEPQAGRKAVDTQPLQLAHITFHHPAQHMLSRHAPTQTEADLADHQQAVRQQFDTVASCVLAGAANAAVAAAAAPTSVQKQSRAFAAQTQPCGRAARTGVCCSRPCFYESALLTQQLARDNSETPFCRHAK
jgi:hypothetical protein